MFFLLVIISSIGCISVNIDMNGEATITLEKDKVWEFPIGILDNVEGHINEKVYFFISAHIGKNCVFSFHYDKNEIHKINISHDLHVKRNGYCIHGRFSMVGNIEDLKLYGGCISDNEDPGVMTFVYLVKTKEDFLTHLKIFNECQRMQTIKV